MAFFTIEYQKTPQGERKMGFVKSSLPFINTLKTLISHLNISQVQVVSLKSQTRQEFEADIRELQEGIKTLPLEERRILRQRIQTMRKILPNQQQA